VKKNLAFIKRTSLENLKKIYQELLDIDIKTKTGQANQEILIDLFIAKK
jgi:DNA polymerase III delta subunit